MPHAGAAGSKVNQKVTRAEGITYDQAHMFPVFSFLILSAPSTRSATCPFADFCRQKKKQARAVAPACFNRITQPHTNQSTMQIILLDGKAWERHRSAFADFIHRIERLIGNPPEADEWLDNDAVCRRLSISPRTLQTLRDTGKIAFSMVGHKCYYRAGDIADLLNSKAE